MISLSELTIDQIHSAYLAKTYTARELIQAYLDRINRFDKNGPQINSLISLSTSALEEADALDRYLRVTGKLKSTLHGIPTIVKDQVETMGIKTTFGSIAMNAYVPTEDATLIKKLKKNGAIIIAKSTMPDWALSWFSTSSVSNWTRNPYCLSRDPGGSSSGTAASIASNFAVLGIGGDTGGSIRLPSSFCNLVGLRCTPGLISRKGMSPLVLPQDTPGPMCRTVTDAALMLDALVGFDPDDPYTATAAINRSLRGGSYGDSLDTNGPIAIAASRLGVLRKQCFGSDSDPESRAVRKTINASLSLLKAQGAQLIDVEIPDLNHYTTFCSVYMSRSRNDIDSFLNSTSGQNGSAPTSIAKIITSKQYPSSAHALKAVATGPSHPHQDPEYLSRVEGRDEFQRLLISILASNDLDALVFPTCPILPPLHVDTADGGKWSQKGAQFPTNTSIASIGWMPSISVPAGFTDNQEAGGRLRGLPVGLEIMGLPFREQELLTLARGVELVVDGRKEPILEKKLKL